MGHASPSTTPTPRTRIVRAVKLQCPACGSHGIIHGWLHLVAACPRCGLRPDRGEPDHFVGGYVVNLGIAEFVAAALWAIMLVATWPNPSWELMQWIAVALVVATPLALYPFTRLVFLAIDLNFQPTRPGDFGRGDPTYK